MDMAVVVVRSTNPWSDLSEIEPHVAEEYVRLYGDPEEAGDVDPEWFRQPAGGLLMAYWGGEVVGCAAWTFLSTLGYRNVPAGWDVRKYAEVKRMFILRPWRGKGLSKVLDEAREEDARNAGVEFLVGETGEEQGISVKAHLEAMGYSLVEPFGKWADNPGSTFFGKRIGLG